MKFDGKEFIKRLKFNIKQEDYYKRVAMQDAQNLSKDWQNVGNDIAEAINKFKEEIREQEK